MKIIIEQDKCVASGQCVLAADDVFDQRDEDGIVEVPAPVSLVRASPGTVAVVGPAVPPAVRPPSVSYATQSVCIPRIGG
ncbi:ferredoxin [Nonomuraea sp. NPDC049695]|uniref:ferredoxin n=1 Tax=Nonomuraea sp. NPDC049695 TaxID=3154734 RepID=UPI0034334DC8